MNKLSAAERPYLEQPWFYKYGSTMRSAGAEFSYLGSLKVQFSGHGVAVAVCYNELADYVKSAIPSGATPSFEDVRHVLQRCSQKTPRHVGKGELVCLESATE